MPMIKLFYTKMPTRFIKRLALLNLSSYESRVFFHVLSLTITWNKKDTVLNVAKEADVINLKRQHFLRAIKSLIARKIIFSYTKKNKQRIVSINEETQQWLHRISVQGALEFEDEGKEAAS